MGKGTRSSFFHSHFWSLFYLFVWTLVVIAFILSFSSASVFSAEVALTWDPNSEEDLAGYRIYYGMASGTYEYTVDVGNQTEYTVSNLEEGLIYFFAATAYDLWGNESDYSNEVSYSPPCYYSISSTSQSFDYSGGNGAVDVIAPSLCLWTAISNADWIILTSNVSGCGNGTVLYTIGENPGDSDRTGTLTIANQTFTIHQQKTPRYSLTVTITGNGTGTIAVDPPGRAFTPGTLVTLTATPDPTSSFEGWSGAVTGTSPVVSLVLNADTAVTAHFRLKTYSIAAIAGVHGSIFPKGTVAVDHGADQQFTIVPDDLYGIAEVKVDGVSIGVVSTYTFHHVTQSHTIEASFVSLLPGAPTLVSPSGKIYTRTPTYVWNAVPSSAQYFLRVNDAGGTRIQQWITAAEAGCSDGLGACSITPTAELAVGTGTWWIMPRNSFGNGPLSQGLSFTVSKPEAATLVSPTGKIKDRTPTYTWNAVGGATKYYLMVNDATGAKVREWYTAAEAGCPSGTGTCSATPNVELAIGTVKWWIQTSNPVGNGPWSDLAYFTVSR